MNGVVRFRFSNNAESDGQRPIKEQNEDGTRSAPEIAF